MGQVGGGCQETERRNQEIFGYNVSLVKGTGTVSGFYAVSGCVDPTAVGDPGCGSGNVLWRIRYSWWGWG